MRLNVRTLLGATFLLVTGATQLVAQQRAPNPERAAARQVLLEPATHLQEGHWPQADSLFATRGVHVLTDTAR